jgi:hypothetical protein
MAYWTSTDHGDKALACALSLTALDSPLGCRVVLGTGELCGSFIGPQKNFMLLGAAIAEAEQLDQFSSSSKNVILFTVSLQGAAVQHMSHCTVVGSFSNRQAVYACAR